MKLRQCILILSIVFLASFAQLATAAKGPEVTLVNQLGNQSYLVMNFDVIETEGDIKDVHEMFGPLISYAEKKSFSDFQRMDNFSFAKTVSSYPSISGNYIYAGLRSTILKPDASCQNLASRFNPVAKNITITVRKSSISPDEISCVMM